MRPGIAGVDAVILKHERLMPMLLGAQCSGYLFRTGHDAAALVVQADQRQMGSHLCPKSGRHICGNIHALTAMVSKAEDGWHHVPAGGGFQGG